MTCRLRPPCQRRPAQLPLPLLRQRRQRRGDRDLWARYRHPGADLRRPQGGHRRPGKPVVIRFKAATRPAAWPGAITIATRGGRTISSWSPSLATGPSGRLVPPYFWLRFTCTLARSVPDRGAGHRQGRQSPGHSRSQLAARGARKGAPAASRPGWPSGLPTPRSRRAHRVPGAPWTDSLEHRRRARCGTTRGRPDSTYPRVCGLAAWPSAATRGLSVRLVGRRAAVAAGGPAVGPTLSDVDAPAHGGEHAIGRVVGTAAHAGCRAAHRVADAGGEACCHGGRRGKRDHATQSLTSYAEERMV